MSRGLTDVPLVVVGNKTDLLSSRDMALDKFRHDVVNKVGRRDSDTVDHLTTGNISSHRHQRCIL